MWFLRGILHALIGDFSCKLIGHDDHSFVFQYGEPVVLHRCSICGKGWTTRPFT